MAVSKKYRRTRQHNCDADADADDADDDGATSATLSTIKVDADFNLQCQFFTMSRSVCFQSTRSWLVSAIPLLILAAAMAPNTALGQLDRLGAPPPPSRLALDRYFGLGGSRSRPTR